MYPPVVSEKAVTSYCILPGLFMCLYRETPDILRGATCKMVVDHMFSRVFWETYAEDIGGWIIIMGLRCLGE